MLDVRPVAFVIGIMLSALAVAMLIPVLAELAVGGTFWAPFLGSAAVTGFVGVGLMLTTSGSGAKLGLRQAFLLTALSWIVIAVFGALPFRFAPYDLSLADCFFEAMSGLTTTGSTVIVGLDRAPPGLLLWRSLLQFIGGVGIIAVAVAVLPALRIGGMQLFRLESTDKSDKVMPRATQIATGIIVAYLLLTATCALLYWIGGMSGFDAINHAMTTVATSGFSTSDSSFAKFDSVFLHAVA
ncbi:potassium transporter TrkG, partial [Bosea sp. (in: a-proteobacteria)]|uniref:potassium transporter TrkG n=1 Tax=Bosea sp. (in: a-proteobacteria) TaxID=1871050 RepID=UPI0025BE98C6